MENFLFSDSELSELETLKIMGGTGFIPEAQAGCINKAKGCGKKKQIKVFLPKYHTFNLYLPMLDIE